MSDDTKSTKPTPKLTFPDTERAPGYLSLWDAETAKAAGVTPYSVLLERYGQDYAAVVSDGVAFGATAGAAGWQFILARAERGARYKIAKMLKEHGAKADVPAEFQAHRDTLSGDAKLRDYLPWAYPIIMAEAQQAAADGKDYDYIPNYFIKVGRDAAKAAGATKDRPKYSGSGKVWMIDPVSHSFETADLPVGFPGSKPAAPRWEEDKKHELRAGPRVWREIGGNRKGYFLFDLPLKDPTTRVVLLCRERVLLLRADNKKVVLAPSLLGRERLRRSSRLVTYGTSPDSGIGTSPSFEQSPRRRRPTWPPPRPMASRKLSRRSLVPKIIVSFRTWS